MVLISSGLSSVFRGATQRRWAASHASMSTSVNRAVEKLLAANGPSQRSQVCSNFVAASLVACYALSFGNESQQSQKGPTQLDAAVALPTSLSGIGGSGSKSAETQPGSEKLEDATTNVINWSGTHGVTVENKHYWEPESIEEVEDIVKKCHESGQPIRPIGASLSPNGLALNAAGMISMAHLDQIVEINVKRKTVTAQAGVTVNQLVEALRPHGLTLPNLASISEQQMGGFVQVGAHGTGRAISPVDHYVTKIKLVTPGMGTLVLSKDRYPSVFHLAKVGLGCLGVVVEVTMECIPAHQLVEHTFVLTRQQAREQLETLLERHKHVRYMWIPYTDAVVVVTNDPEDQLPSTIPRNVLSSSTGSAEDSTKPLTELLGKMSQGTDTPYTPEMMAGMGFGELRDALLAIDPLGLDHVKRCNQAEAEFWRLSEGYQTKPSDKLLQFDCGGQQWVFEVCFPTGTQDENNGNDMVFMERLLAGIEQLKIPAHSPIEQRWSAASSSKMSPAHGPPNGLYSWVGVINYLPFDDEEQRKAITDSFKGLYCDLVRSVGRPVEATSHWAKLEDPESVWRTVDLQLLLQRRYPLNEFNKARSRLDPKNLLSSPLLNLALGIPESA